MKTLKIFSETALSIGIWYVASPSVPLPSLFKLSPGAKDGPAPGVTCYT